MGPAGAAPFVEAPLTPSQRPSAKRPCRREEIVSHAAHAGGRDDELDSARCLVDKMDE